VSFVQALCTETAHYVSTHGKREPIETIYFGGGTPSLLGLDDIEQILGVIHDGFDTSNVVETTLELNPEDADLDYLRGLQLLGFDRLSIGIQSFFPTDLTFLNRCHSAEQSVHSIAHARRAGFDIFSVDLILGIPDQPEEYWRANLQKACDLETPHISTYGLTVEERTVLHKQVERGLVTPESDEVFSSRFQFTMNYLRDRGFNHYEISNFARPGAGARHNQLYWNHSNYLGLGPSAHSFWWKGLPARRWANVRNLRRYEALLAQRQLPLESQDDLMMDALANEYILLRLRLDEGLSLDYLEEQYGVDLLFEKVDELAWLESEGLIRPIRNRLVRLTDRGKQVCDAVTKTIVVTL